MWQAHVPAAGRVCKKMGKEIRNPGGEKSGIVRLGAGRRNVGVPTAWGGQGRPSPRPQAGLPPPRPGPHIKNIPPGHPEGTLKAKRGRLLFPGDPDLPAVGNQVHIALSRAQDLRSLQSQGGKGLFICGVLSGIGDHGVFRQSQSGKQG